MAVVQGGTLLINDIPPACASGFLTRLFSPRLFHWNLAGKGQGKTKKMPSQHASCFRSNKSTVFLGS